VRAPTRSGPLAEIDLILTRGNRRKAVECKNYDPSRAVGTSELRVFKDKLNDIGIASGVVVTNTAFSRDAEQLAVSVGIELWDGEELREKFFAFAIGRIQKPSLLQDPILPIQLDFLTASGLSLNNSHVVSLVNAVLLYHPYFIIKYRLFSQRKDPTGKIHKVNDEGSCIIDSLDGDIINREKGALQSISGLFQSKEKKIESRKDQLVTKDLMSLEAVREPVLKTSDYNVSVVDPAIVEEDALKLTRAYVVEKNITKADYRIKVRGEWDTRSIKIVPKQNEVSIRGQRLVYVPIWNLEYEAGSRTLERRFLASSGEVIENDFAKCVKCTLIKKQPIAVCEECGAPVCEKHSRQEGNRWLCEEHSSSQTSGLFSKFFKR
jgi:hypothetical protein